MHGKRTDIVLTIIHFKIDNCYHSHHLCIYHICQHIVKTRQKSLSAVARWHHVATPLCNLFGGSQHCSLGSAYMRRQRGLNTLNKCLTTGDEDRDEIVLAVIHVKFDNFYRCHHLWRQHIYQHTIQTHSGHRVGHVGTKYGRSLIDFQKITMMLQHSDTTLLTIGAMFSTVANIAA